MGDIISPILLVASFTVAVVKPLRKKFIEWLGKVTNRDKMMKRLEGIEGAMIVLKSEVADVKQTLVSHAKENRRDLSKSRDAHLISLRGQIEEIYRRNLTSRTLTTIEQRDVFDFFEAYDVLDGNGYIKSLVNDMATWKIVEAHVPCSGDY